MNEMISDCQQSSFEYCIRSLDQFRNKQNRNPATNKKSRASFIAVRKYQSMASGE
jgi:hypothetical protein